MASILFARDGHDWGKPNLDGLGIFYIVFAIVYTLIVAAGLFALWIHRDSTAVRIRSLPVTCSAVISIHIYLVLVFIVYPLNGLFKCSAEFWIMSAFLPLSMALFQASNVRLLSYYDAQRSLIHAQTLLGKRRRRRLMGRGLLRSWSELSSVEKTYVGIGVGLVLQLLTTSVLFFGSRRFHEGYGFFGRHVNVGLCRRGLEWIPSVFWQFLWASVFGPYVLLRIRHVHDTRYWGRQTRLAIIACLPGTPLWLTFMYSKDPVLANINKWFVPPGWFLPGLMAMQWVSIVFPLLDVHQNTIRGDRPRSMHKTRSQTPTAASKQRGRYSMASLEMQLEHDVNPLLRWAAQKEFTAENIVFLRNVRDFKRKWAAALTRSQLTPSQLRERYEEAALIFFTLVNPSTAKFNINIDDRTCNGLALWFSGLRYESFEDDSSSSVSGSAPSNVITPWADAHRPLSTHSDEGRLVSDPGRLVPIHVTDSTSDVSVQGSIAPSNLVVPAKFNAEIFDAAYASVKRDVFLNTWPRFVDAGETKSTDESDITVISYDASEDAKSLKY